ncbi:haloacid dehalogenase type II [Sphingomonas sp. TREG-RG-20F-R18-01]|uniref:haloacid dehalogenase type II n=1 Tax=Sphingomonas sp. TREG-RG-20F-R18-01 TaxID=2914982 RepID=UPI001F5A90FD|nr:haloacid dehalogenase type II [Sphingomonas sp. TREG-RG-20F-R18-01]
MTAPLIVFDVNETLLDIDVLEPLFTRIFSSKGRMREWFAQLILYSETLSLNGDYVPFGKLGAGVLRMLGEIYHVPITDAQVKELSGLIANLPVHHDVSAALHRLKAAGFTLVTLTNTPAGPGPDPLDKAGLGALFDRRFTVEPARRFKPSPATYQLVADTMKAARTDTWLVAAHTWDTIGAQSFGWNAALVTRGINAPLVLDGVPQPTVAGASLTEVADAILSRGHR